METSDTTMTKPTRRSERRRGLQKNKDNEDARVVKPTALRKALMKLVEQSASSPTASIHDSNALSENNDAHEAHGQGDPSPEVTVAPNKDSTELAQSDPAVSFSKKRQNKRKRSSSDEPTVDQISDQDGAEAQRGQTKRQKLSESLTSSTTVITTGDAVPTPPNQSPEMSTWHKPEMTTQSDVTPRLPYYPHPQFLPLQVMSALATTIHSRRERIFTSLYETDDEHYVPMEIVLPSEARHLGLPWDVCEKFSPRGMHFEDNTEDEIQVWREEQLDWNKAWVDL